MRLKSAVGHRQKTHKEREKEWTRIIKIIKRGGRDGNVQNIRDIYSR